MEANENSGLTTYSYPTHHQPQPTLSPQPAAPSDNDGDGAGGVLFPQSVAGKAPAVEPQKRKRGRPRKYETPEAAAAAKKAALPAKRKEREFLKLQQQQFLVGCGGGGPSSHSSSATSKKSYMGSLGGQGFTPHVLNVAVGEDVGQKIMLFMQQTKRELCILSASGSVKSAALRQPATSGGNIAYEGHFDIISLTGSYVRSDLGGKAGGLSACLSSEKGQIVGGGVGGPLIAAGPVEVIVATFLIDPRKTGNADLKGDVSATTMPSPVSASTGVYRPEVPSGGFMMTAGSDHQNMDGSAFMLHSQWRSGINYNLTGNTGHNSHDSPENGDYEHQMPD